MERANSKVVYIWRFVKDCEPDGRKWLKNKTKFNIANHKEQLRHLQHKQSVVTEFLSFGKEEEKREKKPVFKSAM